MIRLAACLVMFAGLAACAPPMPARHGSAAQSASCQRRADEVYLRQNRNEIYRDDAYATSGRDARFSAGGVLQAPSLSDRFAREQLLDNCMAARSGTPGAAPAGPDTVPPPPKP